MTHRSQHDFKIKIEPLSTEGLTEPTEANDDESADVNSYWRESKLFSKQTDYLGAKKTINLSYDRNMKISIYQTKEVEGDVLLTTYVLDNIDELASSEAAAKEDTTSLKVSLSFELTRSYLL